MIADFIAVFIAGFFIDVLYVFWVIKSAEKKKFQSAIFSSLLILPNLFGIVNVVDNHILALPYAIGLGFGSYFGLLIDEYIKCRITKKS